MEFDELAEFIKNILKICTSGSYGFTEKETVIYKQQTSMTGALGWILIPNPNLGERVSYNILYASTSSMRRMKRYGDSDGVVVPFLLIEWETFVMHSLTHLIHSNGKPKEDSVF